MNKNKSNHKCRIGIIDDRGKVNPKNHTRIAEWILAIPFWINDMFYDDCYYNVSIAKLGI